MAQATRKEDERSPLAIHLAQGLKEAALWLFLVAGLVLLLALSTYSARDPAFTYSGEAGHVHNAIGPFGAHQSSASASKRAISASERVPSCIIAPEL